MSIHFYGVAIAHSFHNIGCQVGKLPAPIAFFLMMFFGLNASSQQDSYAAIFLQPIGNLFVSETDTTADAFSALQGIDFNVSVFLHLEESSEAYSFDCMVLESGDTIASHHFMLGSVPNGVYTISNVADDFTFTMGTHEDAHFFSCEVIVRDDEDEIIGTYNYNPN